MVTTGSLAGIFLGIYANLSKVWRLRRVIHGSESRGGKHTVLKKKKKSTLERTKSKYEKTNFFYCSAGWTLPSKRGKVTFVVRLHIHWKKLQNKYLLLYTKDINYFDYLFHKCNHLHKNEN